MNIMQFVSIAETNAERIEVLPRYFGFSPSAEISFIP